MKTIYLYVFAFWSFNLLAQTQVSGNQSGVWALSGSPYQVTNDVTVPAGQTLNIDAGVEIVFQGHYKMIVNGQIFVNGTSSQPVVFTASNHTTGWAGVRFDTNTLISQFHHAVFEYGIATGNYPDMHGGAILLKDSDAEFYNCIFRNNQALGSGDDGMGGAVYGINTGSSTQTLTKFIDCKFLNNSSITEGGAIKMTNDGNSEFTNCEFINNNARYGGGAILFYSALNVKLNHCLFYQNSADNSGGGAIKTLNPTVSLFFTNCTFVKNEANGSGEGGAMALDYANVTIVNSIIYDNQQTYGDEVNIGMNASATINYSDVNMPSGASGNNNIYQNPLFVDENNGNLHLQANSPCIDAGIDVGLAYLGSAPDMGCYEYQGQGQITDYKIFPLDIYPNPTVDKLFVQDVMNILSLDIFDISAKQVWHQSQASHIIDVSQLSPGAYQIVVKTKDNNTYTGRFIKE